MGASPNRCWASDFPNDSSDGRTRSRPCGWMNNCPQWRIANVHPTAELVLHHEQARSPKRRAIPPFVTCSNHVWNLPRLFETLPETIQATICGFLGPDCIIGGGYSGTVFLPKVQMLKTKYPEQFTKGILIEGLSNEVNGFYAATPPRKVTPFLWLYFKHTYARYTSNPDATYIIGCIDVCDSDYWSLAKANKGCYPDQLYSLTDESNEPLPGVHPETCDQTMWRKSYRYS